MPFTPLHLHLLTQTIFYLYITSKLVLVYITIVFTVKNCVPASHPLLTKDDLYTILTYTLECQGNYAHIDAVVTACTCGTLENLDINRFTVQMGNSSGVPPKSKSREVIS